MFIAILAPARAGIRLKKFNLRNSGPHLRFARLVFPMLFQVRRKDAGVPETLMRNFRVVRPHKTMKKA